MEEIKVGTYVRTKEGCIFQIVGQSKRVDHTLYDTDNFGICSNTVLEEITKKQSKNILDLIEEGDYVSGYNVIEINKHFEVQPYRISILVYKSNYHEQWININNDNLKDIVTKEQFNSGKYIVGDE